MKTVKGFQNIKVSSFSTSVSQYGKLGIEEVIYILLMFKRILKRAGLPEMRFYDCRHTFSLVALANGVDFKMLSAMLGHYSVAFTLDVYGHVNDDMKRDAADKVSGVLRRAL